MRKKILQDFINEANLRSKEAKEAEDLLDKIFSFLNDEELFYTLNPSISSMFSPFLFRDMFKSCDRIIKALSNNENILIFGDRDADGIIGTFILKNFLDEFKLHFNSSSEVFYEVPEENEVYGIVPECVESYRDRVSLIITVDNGISALDAAKRASELGVDMIITDHHQPYEDGILKFAFSVINPKMEGVGVYLSGAGVVFFLVLGLLILYFYKGIRLNSIFFFSDTSEFLLLEIEDFVSKVTTVGMNEISNLISSREKENFVFIDAEHLKSVSALIPNLHSFVGKHFLINCIAKGLGLGKQDFSALCNKFRVADFCGLPEVLTKVLFLMHILGKTEIKKYLDRYLPLVGLTVLSDSMPFLSYNKFFVREATERISKVDVDSVRFIVSCRVGKDRVSVNDLVMKVIPFVNSAGRMGRAGKVVELLLEKDLKEIKKLFGELEKLDFKRKEIATRFISSISEKIGKESVFVEPSLERGVISLISTKISSKVNFPVVVMSNGGNGDDFFGSARFRKGDVFSIMKSLSHYFKSFAGHKSAVGFVISKEKIDDFIRDFLAIDYTKFYEQVLPIMRIRILDFHRNYARLFYLVEPLNEELRPVFEDEVVLLDYKKDFLPDSYSVKIGDLWFTTVCNEEKVRSSLSKSVRILYSYEFRFDNELQQELFCPKILEIK
ncbi:MAG: DHH family phosphoesterase [Brevinematia bacterium]